MTSLLTAVTCSARKAPNRDAPHHIPRYVYFAVNDSLAPVAFEAFNATAALAAASAAAADDDHYDDTAHAGGHGLTAARWARDASGGAAAGWRRCARFVVNVTNIDDDTAGVRVLQTVQLNSDDDDVDAYDDDDASPAPRSAMPCRIRISCLHH